MSWTHHALSSRSQLVRNAEALRDPRYSRDEAFRQYVEARIIASDLSGLLSRGDSRQKHGMGEAKRSLFFACHGGYSFDGQDDDTF